MTNETALILSPTVPRTRAAQAEALAFERGRAEGYHRGAQDAIAAWRSTVVNLGHRIEDMEPLIDAALDMVAQDLQSVSAEGFDDARYSLERAAQIGRPSEALLLAGLLVMYAEERL